MGEFGTFFLAAEPPLATDHDEISVNFDLFFFFDTQPVTNKSKTGCEIFIPEYCIRSTDWMCRAKGKKRAEH